VYVTTEQPQHLPLRRASPTGVQTEHESRKTVRRHSNRRSVTSIDERAKQHQAYSDTNEERFNMQQVSNPVKGVATLDARQSATDAQCTQRTCDAQLQRSHLVDDTRESNTVTFPYCPHADINRSGGNRSRRRGFVYRDAETFYERDLEF
jgi:hypothetical protein